MHFGLQRGDLRWLDQTTLDTVLTQYVSLVLLSSVCCPRTKTHTALVVLLLQRLLHDSVVGEHAGSVGAVMRKLRLFVFVS